MDSTTTNTNINKTSGDNKRKRFIIVKRPKDKVEEYDEEKETPPTIVEQKQQQQQQQQVEPKTKNTLAEYISQLSEQELIVMKIANEHLKTSFDLEKSSGYLQYLRKQQIAK